MADSITAAIQTQIMNLETEVSDLATRVAALEKLLQDYPPTHLSTREEHSKLHHIKRRSE